MKFGNRWISISHILKKVACMPQSKEDVLTLLLSCYEHKTISKKCAISMSDMGMISRIIGEMFDSEYTFCSLTTSSAPGQLPLEKMVEYLNILGFDKARNCEFKNIGVII